MKVSYYSLGCKVNLYESEAIVNEFIENGFELTNFDDICDIYIINTCTVTKTSDAKSRKIIRQAIKKNPNAVICVMGCYSQLHPDEVKQIEGVDVIVGTSNRIMLYPLAMSALEKKNPQVLIQDALKTKNYEELKIKRFNNKTRGFIKIEDGCNNFCTYCAIPYARGPVRSRNHQDVIDEIKLLTEQGTKEIVLTGINTAAYGSDLKDYTFAKLLEDIVKNVPNLGRIRISSIEATEITDELLSIIAENREKFCNHFHIPLQSGSDKILQKMARKYNLDYYRKKIQRIRQLFPGVNITTDVMVGFSGETNEDFNDIKNFINEIKFGEMHVFPYSKRPGTKAYTYPDEVDEITKKVRVNELLLVNEQNALAYRQNFVGTVQEVIIEKIENGKAFGHTSNYMDIEFDALDSKVNDLVQVEIIEAGYPISIGKLGR
ncbi:MAG TPA: tRNA (N(6)-L-threonylcarbamoyladenosine(37)-C(2))-methylthiotransferase MtaB [Bacilli bacterium]|nr:tRNA (N(6)-L-threonylcarbamoyladenosine(37)-C(2))-methylthiotransferase MtaB [Bacilli bacterium]